MVVARCINQLHVDADAAARFLHAALEDVGNTELATDFRQILRPAAIALGRGPRDHLQIADLGQPGQDFVLDTVGKIGVVLVGAKVFKRQDGDGFGRDCAGRLRRRGSDIGRRGGRRGGMCAAAYRKIARAARRQ